MAAPTQERANSGGSGNGMPPRQARGALALRIGTDLHLWVPLTALLVGLAVLLWIS